MRAAAAPRVDGCMPHITSSRRTSCSDEHAQNALIGSSARAKRRANDSRRPASWARYILRGYAVHTALLSEARSSALFVSVAADLLLEGVDAVLVL